MCMGKCSRFVGFALLPMALICIIANLLLIFPNAETKWTNHITMQVWLMGGLGGAGLFMLCPSCNAIRAGGEGCCGKGCCGNRCRMLRSMISSILGGLGSFYCLVVSGTALNDGPLCNFNDKPGKEGNWDYHFKGMNVSYLTHKDTWDLCVQPANIVMWHIVLFSILLGISAIEFVLCAVQIINSLFGVVCGDCQKDDKA